DERDPGRRRQSLRRLPGELRGEVSQGDRVPGEGPRRAALVLRLPGRALEAPADDEPDRIDVRHDPAAASKNERQRQPRRLADDDVQTRRERREALATAQRLRTVTRRPPRR